MRYLTLFALATVVSAIPFPNEASKRDSGALVTTDIEKRDFQTLINSVENDVAAVISGDGTVVTVVTDLLANLEDILGVDALNGTAITIGKRSATNIAKRDLQTLLNGLENDLAAVINGDGSVSGLLSDFLNNLVGTVGADSLLDLGVTIGKRNPALINLNLQIPLLQELQSLLEQILSTITGGGDTADVESAVSDLLTPAQSLASSLGLSLKRSPQLDTIVSATLEQVAALVSSLLDQVNSILGSL